MSFVGCDEEVSTASEGLTAAGGDRLWMVMEGSPLACRPRRMASLNQSVARRTRSTVARPSRWTIGDMRQL